MRIETDALHLAATVPMFAACAVREAYQDYMQVRKQRAGGLLGSGAVAHYRERLRIVYRLTHGKS